MQLQILQEADNEISPSHPPSDSQQDAQEFLRFLLDRLHTEINRRPSHHPAIFTTPEPSYTQFRYTQKSSDLKQAAAIQPYNHSNLTLTIPTRISEEAAALWKKHVDKDDSIIVGKHDWQDNTFYLKNFLFKNMQLQYVKVFLDL